MRFDCFFHEKHLRDQHFFNPSRKQWFSREIPQYAISRRQPTSIAGLRAGHLRIAMSCFSMRSLKVPNVQQLDSSVGISHSEHLPWSFCGNIVQIMNRATFSMNHLLMVSMVVHNFQGSDNCDQEIDRWVRNFAEIFMNRRTI
jgi:hypothetical protein